LNNRIIHYDEGPVHSFTSRRRPKSRPNYAANWCLHPDLFDEMYASLADRSSRKLLNRLSRVDVLVIDEMGYLNLRPEQTNIFFKLMEERYRRHPTIITTNLDYSEWANFLGNKSLVEALLSRLRHQCHTVRIDGPSLREPASNST
jgi:DNA replication protein DnaC